MDKKNKNPNVPNLRFDINTNYIDKNLKDLCSIMGGYAFDSNKMRSKGSYQIVKMGNLYNDCLDLARNPSFIDSPTPKELEYSLKQNDIIITLTGTVGKKDYGYTVQIKNESHLLLNQRCALIRPYSINAQYLYYLLKSSQFKNQFFSSSTGGTGNQTNVSTSDILKFSVRIPCEKEQLKIGRLFHILDERIQTQSKIIKIYSSLMKAISFLLFSKIETKKQLSEICVINKGKQINGENLLENGTYYMMNGGTSPSGYLNIYNKEANMISISEGGNSCGYVQFNNVKFWSGGHCYTIENIKPTINNKFLYYYLKYNESKIMNLRIGTGLPNIQKKDLEQFKVAIPNFKIQIQITHILNCIETKLNIEKELLTLYQLQKSYLLKNMFV